MKTVFENSQTVRRDWFVVDASGKTLGRLASAIALRLRGKHKPAYTPHVDCGDNIIVVNAEKITVTGNKLDEKIYYSISGYPGGMRETPLRKQLAVHPDRVIRSAVWGMLPHTKMGRQLIKKLKVYGGAEHPHVAQNPQPVA